MKIWLARSVRESCNTNENIIGHKHFHVEKIVIIWNTFLQILLFSNNLILKFHSEYNIFRVVFKNVLFVMVEIILFGHLYVSGMCVVSLFHLKVTYILYLNGHMLDDICTDELLYSILFEMLNKYIEKKIPL